MLSLFASFLSGAENIFQAQIYIVTKPSSRSKWREDQQAMAHLGLRSNTWASGTWMIREWIYDMRQGGRHFMAFLKYSGTFLVPICISGGRLHISSPLGCKNKSLWKLCSHVC